MRPANGDFSLNSTIAELPGSGWLAAEPEATPQTHRLRPRGFPTVSPSHPRVFPHHGYNESRWSSARSLSKRVADRSASCDHAAAFLHSRCAVPLPACIWIRDRAEKYGGPTESEKRREFWTKPVLVTHGGSPRVRGSLRPRLRASARYRGVGKIGRSRSPASTKSELVRLVAITDCPGNLRWVGSGCVKLSGWAVRRSGVREHLLDGDVFGVPAFLLLGGI